MGNWISTKDMSRKEWLMARHGSIGASEVSAIMGVNKYRTPLDVYLEKIEPEPVDLPPNEFMEAGIMNEESIARWYAKKTGDNVIQDHKIRYHPTLKFLSCNLDRVIAPRSILECKNVYRDVDDWENGVPDHVFAQVQAQMNVTGYSMAVVAVMIGGYKLIYHAVGAAEPYIANMNERLEEFWHGVQNKVPPPPMKAEDVLKLHPASRPASTIDVTSEIMGSAMAVQGLKEEIKMLEGRQKEHELIIKAAMGDTEIIVRDGKPLVTWKSYTANRFNSKAFAADEPELYGKYMQASEYRRFTIKKIKEGDQS